MAPKHSPQPHPSFSSAQGQATSPKQVGLWLVAELERLTGATAGWMLQMRSDQSRPLLLCSPSHQRLPQVLPMGLAAWALAHRQIILARGERASWQVTKSLLKPFEAPANPAALREKLKADLAWLGPTANSSTLLFLPFETQVPAVSHAALQVETLIILKLKRWSASQAKALAAFAPVIPLLLGMAEQNWQMEQRLRLSNAVSEIAENMNATLDLEILLRLILLEVTKTLQCQAGDIWLKAEKQRNLVFKTSLGLSNAVRGLLLSGEQSQAALDREEPIWIEDAATLAGPQWAALNEEAIRSLAVVPIKTKNKVIGILHVFSKQKKIFTLEEKNLLKILVNQAATAIDQAKLFDETKRRAQELLALYEIAQFITEKSTLNQALKNIVERVSEVLNVEKCWFMLHDRQTGCLVAHPAAIGLDDEQIAGLVFPAQAHGMAAHVFQTGRPMFSNNAETEIALQAEFSRLFTLRMIMVVPLRSRNQSFGIFVAANKRDQSPFKGADVRFFSTLASETTAVIENARWYDQLNRRYLSILQVITDMVDMREPYRPGHSRRVSNLATALAEKIKCDPEEIELIRMAGMLHDIGKIGLGDTPAIDTGPDRETEVLRLHPQTGAQFLQKVEFPLSIHPLVLSHHEWFNGQGVPTGLQGEAIPRGARMIAIADAFDMWTSSLDDQRRLEPEQAWQRLQLGAGTQFDPWLVEEFKTIWPQAGVEARDAE